MAIFDRIKFLMEEDNINNASLEKYCGLSNGLVGKWEQGKAKPSVCAIVKIAKFFNVSTDYILEQTDSLKNEIHGNVTNSAVAQGHSAQAIYGSKEMGQEEKDLLSIFGVLDGRQRHKLLKLAYTLEDEYKRRNEGCD